MKETVWNLPPARPIPGELLQAGFTPLLAAALASRGIETVREAEEALASGPEALGDPFLLAGMDRAVARIREAMERGERVAVYGDYDVDGITAACLLTEYLRGEGMAVEIYIPDRTEGYGLNVGAVELLRDRGVSLIITVDTGITAVAETAHAASLGVDMVITDHHECQDRLPEAVAVVDPKQPGCPYPDRHLAGVGVAFKLVCALSGDTPAMMARFSDLVAMGTVADVMPLTGENRHLVTEGLEKLRQHPSPGLGALMEANGIRPAGVNAAAISYRLAPCINAAGRLFRVADSAALVLERDPARAAERARALCEINLSRRRLEAEMMAEAGSLLDETAGEGPIVLAREGWHQGVIGIAASRVVDRYRVPAVMISLEGNRGKGSGRSYGDFDLFAALTACREYLNTFGGHAEAAGLTIDSENIEGFRLALREYYRAHPPAARPALSPDVLVQDPGWLSLEGVRSLDRLEPCGAANPRPLCCMTGLRLVSLSGVGNDAHTKMQAEKGGILFDCIWFGHNPKDLEVFPGCEVDLAFDPEINEFRGRSSVQLQVRGMRRAGDVSLREILEGNDAHPHRLSRGELGTLWRALEARCPAELSWEALPSLAPALSPGQIALGLRVLGELDLARVTAGAAGVEISLPGQIRRARLQDSAAWQRHHS